MATTKPKRKMNPNSLENLRPVKTKEEASARGRNGGRKSGQTKRERKLLKEVAETCLYDTLINDAGKIALKRRGIVIEDSKDLQAIYAMMFGLIAEGIKGNANSAKLVLEAAGLMPKDDEVSESESNGSGVVFIAPVMEKDDE